MNNSAELLLVSLKDFYEDKKHVENLIQIIDGPSPISLRLIDWFITSYCKNVRDGNPQYKTLKSIYQDYRSQLKAYKKLKFDPFRRRQRISFKITDQQAEEDISINTTIGQLNFFKWAIDNGILKYINENFDTLESAMNTHQKSIKKKNDDVPTTVDTMDADKLADSMHALSTSSTIYFD